MMGLMRQLRNVIVAAVLTAATIAAQAGQPAPAKKTAWTLGIYSGPSPLKLQPAAGVVNPVLTGADVTDMKVDTLAHPFMLIQGKRYYVFFTAKDIKADKGGIGLAESSDGMHWKFRRTVIREPFVLAHPFVFESKGEYYMIPEAHTETSVRLYKATAFPDQWKYEGNLIEGKDEHFISPTLAHYNGLWWMFTSPTGNAALRLFMPTIFEAPGRSIH
jgi:hypothetical protein